MKNFGKNNSNPTRTVVMTALAGALAMGASLSAQAVPDQPENWEKCANIGVKAGMNDCGVAGKHDCAGQAKVDNDPKEWVYLPAGTCAKIDGEVLGSKPAKA